MNINLFPLWLVPFRHNFASRFRVANFRFLRVSNRAMLNSNEKLRIYKRTQKPSIGYETYGSRLKTQRPGHQKVAGHPVRITRWRACVIALPSYVKRGNTRVSGHTLVTLWELSHLALPTERLRFFSDILIRRLARGCSKGIALHCSGSPFKIPAPSPSILTPPIPAWPGLNFVRP